MKNTVWNILEINMLIFTTKHIKHVFPVKIFLAHDWSNGVNSRKTVYCNNLSDF